MRIRTLVDLIHEDWVTHGRDYTRPGFKAIAVYRFGVWRMSIYPKLFRAPFSVIYRMLYRRARNVYGIEIPYTAKVGRRVRIDHQHGIVIHGNSEIGDEYSDRVSPWVIDIWIGPLMPLNWAVV